MQDPTHKVIRNNLIDEVFQMVQEIRESAPYDPIVDSVCRAVNVRLSETKVDFDPNIFERFWNEVKHFTDLHYTVAVIADDPAVCNRVLFLAYRIIGYVGEARRPLYGDDYILVPDNNEEAKAVEELLNESKLIWTKVDKPSEYALIQLCN